MTAHPITVEVEVAVRRVTLTYPTRKHAHHAQQIAHQILDRLDQLDHSHPVGFTAALAASTDLAAGDDDT